MTFRNSPLLFQQASSNSSRPLSAQAELVQLGQTNSYSNRMPLFWESASIPPVELIQLSSSI
ncbi:hypothetical protein [Sphingobacterium sp. UME9]|uniref:hypothetical protein n=1 Tax=Sphingobacterium sp. UME9 TaxID=1862316 RepID=UPI001602B231|nr:hypothetical protein [Sphingobacterium sp. UME9]